MTTNSNTNERHASKVIDKGLPTPECIALNLTAHLKACIDKHTLGEISCSLAYGFEEDQLPSSSAWDLVGEYWGSELTPALAHELAVKAIRLVQEKRAAAVAHGA